MSPVLFPRFPLPPPSLFVIFLGKSELNSFWEITCRMFALSSRGTLSREIIEKFESVKESEQTARKKKAWCERLERNIKERYPTSRLILAGSSSSGFAIEGCDVDLTLIRPDRTVLFYSSDSGVQVLRRIQDGLRTMRTINTEVIYPEISRQFVYIIVTVRAYLKSLTRVFWG